MLILNEAIIVEGLHDKIKLEQIVDATIISTNGFAIYKDKPKLNLIKKLAAQKGLIILTDSDSAGNRIRSYLKGCLGDLPVKHAYIPHIKGKERRKAKPGKEGLLGVEGMDAATLEMALARAGCTVNHGEQRRHITKADLFEAGLSGGSESKAARQKLARSLQLPVNISTNGLLDVLNALYKYEEYSELVKDLGYNS